MKITYLSAVFLLLSILLTAYDQIYPNPLNNIFAFTLLLTYIIATVKACPISISLNAYYIYSMLTMVLSGVLIGYGVPLREIGAVGTYSSAFILLTMYYIFSLTFVLGGIDILSNKKNKHRIEDRMKFKQGEKLQTISMVIVAIVCGYMIQFGLRNGYPILNGIDRFDYRVMFKDDYIFQLFFANRPLMCVLMGISFIKGKNRSFAFVLYVLVLLNSFLYGEKFISIVNMTIYFLVPKFVAEVDGGKINIRAVVKYAVLASALVVLCMTAVYYVYTNANDSSRLVSEQIYQRIAAQGQLWYASTLNEVNGTAFDASALHREFETLWVNGDTDSVKSAAGAPYTGMQYLMYKYMTDVFYWAYSQRGVQLIGGYEAYSLEMFGISGMLMFQIIVLSCVVAVKVYLLKNIREANVIGVTLAMKMVVLQDVGLVMGDYYTLFGIGFLKFAFLAIIYEKIIKHLVTRDYNGEEPRVKKMCTTVYNAHISP